MGTLSSHFQGIPGGVVMSLIAFSIVFIALSGLCLIIYGVKYLAAAVDASARAKGNTKAAKASALSQWNRRTSSASTTRPMTHTETPA